MKLRRPRVNGERSGDAGCLAVLCYGFEMAGPQPAHGKPAVAQPAATVLYTANPPGAAVVSGISR